MPCVNAALNNLIGLLAQRTTANPFYQITLGDTEVVAGHKMAVKKLLVQRFADEWKRFRPDG